MDREATGGGVDERNEAPVRRQRAERVGVGPFQESAGDHRVAHADAQLVAQHGSRQAHELAESRIHSVVRDDPPVVRQRLLHATDSRKQHRKTKLSNGRQRCISIRRAECSLVRSNGRLGIAYRLLEMDGSLQELTRRFGCLWNRGAGGVPIRHEHGAAERDGHADDRCPPGARGSRTEARDHGMNL